MSIVPPLDPHTSCGLKKNLSASEPSEHPSNKLTRGGNCQNMYVGRPAVRQVVVVFLPFSVLIANPKKLLYTATNSASGLLKREKRTK